MREKIIKWLNRLFPLWILDRESEFWKELL